MHNTAYKFLVINSGVIEISNTIMKSIDVVFFEIN